MSRAPWWFIRDNKSKDDEAIALCCNHLLDSDASVRAFDRTRNNYSTPLNRPRGLPECIFIATDCSLLSSGRHCVDSQLRSLTLARVTRAVRRQKAEKLEKPYALGKVMLTLLEQEIYNWRSYLRRHLAAGLVEISMLKEGVGEANARLPSPAPVNVNVAAESPIVRGMHRLLHHPHIWTCQLDGMTSPELPLKTACLHRTNVHHPAFILWAMSKSPESTVSYSTLPAFRSVRRYG
ncbi:hypothetical protein DE146DRAFT_632818 [Phaeosphaeria sp. MPI-PUGE-AT-0046c]|nr:hypothetical protein DE146DRAFT_632818 [Phaeosphaeria sp. MPI-PUGE-AT-0046c]